LFLQLVPSMIGGDAKAFQRPWQYRQELRPSSSRARPALVGTRSQQ
jgi:hypothetical protein